MATITLGLPSPGQGVTAGLHSANYAAIQALLNGSLDNANISGAASLDAVARVGVRKNSAGSTFNRRRINFIEGSGVTLTVADDSGGEEVDVTIAASGGTLTTYSKITQKEVINSTTETDLLNGEITIGAGVLGANGWADIFLSGDMVHNTTDTTLRMKVKLGATTIWDSGAQNVANFGSANRVGWAIQMRLSNIGATNVQQLLGTFNRNTGVVASVAGWGTGAGSADASRGFAGGFGGAAAEDTTSAKALVVTAQWGVAGAALGMRLNGAHIVVHQKA